MKDTLQFRMTSPLTKARLTDSVRTFPVYERTTALQGDRVYFSAVWEARQTPYDYGIRTPVVVEGPLSPYVTTYLVEHVPVRLPHYRNSPRELYSFDGDYIDHQPGLYPDVLRQTNEIFIYEERTGQLYFELDLPKDITPGSYPVTVTLHPEKSAEPISATLTLEVLAGVLPEIDFTCAQWFHYDCLASYYGVEVFSERHWEIVEKFARMAVKIGNNALMTPIFTPPLDTEVGGERPTVQLVDVTVTENGQYVFGFDKLKRFCEMCHRVGVKELEIAHLFTQWGAEHAPKVMATVNGEYKRIFGWETDAVGDEYTPFLRALIPAVREKLDEYGYRGHYFFHISDEPNQKHFESYGKAKDSVWDLICDCPVRDALSHYAYYERGISKNPIPLISYADEFVANNVPDLWVYYCLIPCNKGSNRFIAMPAQRTRVIGAQMYKAGVTGFLHWGYNFYYSRFSRYLVNPYLSTDADYYVPAGDAVTVYPGQDGTPVPSLRAVLFEQAIYDMRAMTLAEQVSGRDAVIAAIDRCCKVDFMHYPTHPEYLLNLREEINRLATGS